MRMASIYVGPTAIVDTQIRYERLDEADLTQPSTIGSREQIRVDQYPVSNKGGYSRYHRYYGYRPIYGTETRVRQYRCRVSRAARYPSESAYSYR